MLSLLKRNGCHAGFPGREGFVRKSRAKRIKPLLFSRVRSNLFEVSQKNNKKNKLFLGILGHYAKNA